jgi:hypothetical protein
MSNKPMREQFPDIAKCVDDLRAMGFVISSMAMYSEDGALLAGKLPLDDPAECVLPAERVIAMQVWARTPEPTIQKSRPKSPAKSRKGKRR